MHFKILYKETCLIIVNLKTGLVAQNCNNYFKHICEKPLYQQGPLESDLICNAGSVFVNPQNGACPRIFNYYWFTVVMEDILHYAKIYIKGYQDTHPINILLMFQLSFCKMVRGGIREQLKWFISDTDMHWKRAQGRPAALHSFNTK